MLKKFFLNTLSSFVGAWIALGLFGVVAVLVCISVATKIGLDNGKAESVSKGSVMTIDLSGTISERETPSQFDYISLMQGNLEKPQTLAELTEAIRKAKDSKNVSAIYLKCKGVSAGLATLQALRSELEGFKESGKKIYAYGDAFTMGDYYVGSVSDSLWINPEGMLALQGVGGTNFFLKGLFDKIGVQFQVVKVGTYKSAVEPYIHTEMSEPARAQLDTLYNTLWESIRTDIASSRKSLDPEKINELTDGYLMTKSATFLKKSGLVDRLLYERTVDSIIAENLGKDPDKIKFVSPRTFLSSEGALDLKKAKKHIAVLYACGEIEDGGGKSAIDYTEMVPQIVELADDDNVKGLVLRVNSPGGSAFGSEQIGEALDYFQSKGKPLAVSMGDYAASGGYWISAGANRIFADPLTITGSIGIFGLIPNAAALLDKIGVTPQTVSTNPSAAFPSLFRPMDEGQTEAMQKFVERGYDKFVARVAKGRKMKEEKVRRIGEGRVWSAPKALEIGLVDQLGSLQEATGWVAGKADLGEDYTTVAYPEIEPGIWDFIPELAGMKLQEAMHRALSGDYDELMIRFAANVLARKPLQARMPLMTVGFGNGIR